MESKPKRNIKALVRKKIDGGEMKHLQNVEAISKIGTLAEEEDKIIRETIDEIWTNYNDDGNDVLDIEEFE